MIIPKQLQNKEFRFVLLGKWHNWLNNRTKERKVFLKDIEKIDKNLWKPLGKAPFEKDWQNKEYTFDNPKLIEHIQTGNNFGVIGGYGNLRILDIDDPILAIEFDKKLDTYAIKTGSGGRHYYFISDYDKNHVLINELGELRAKNYQVVSAPCKHPTGNYYRVVKDIPIKEITEQELLDLIKPYIREENVTTAPITDKKEDTSRSGLEYRKIIALLREGKARDEIYKIMDAYSKWNNSTEQYKAVTFEKAENFVLIENENKQIGIKQNLEPSIECMKYLGDTNLFETLNNEFKKKVVGEEESCKVISLCCYGGRLVTNCQIASYNLLVNDDAGTGKDYVVASVLELLPKEVYIRKTRISPTVFTYWHNSKFEPEWTWDNKVFYAEDISELVLNSDVFKVMSSSGTSATITIHQQAVDVEIKGKPCMITTTATSVPNPELVRRFVILNLDSSINQTKAIMKKHSEFKRLGITPYYNEILKEALKYLQPVKVKIPFADIIHEHFPSENVIMRTHYPRFLDFIAASAALHQYQRTTDNQGFILATGQDYDIARNCFKKLTSNKYMIPLTINQKKILQIFERNPTMAGTATELHTNRKMDFISEKALITNLGLLQNYGLVEANTIEVNYRERTSYRLSSGYGVNEKLNIPSFSELCRNSSVGIIGDIGINDSVGNITNNTINTTFAPEELQQNDYSIDLNPIKPSKLTKLKEKGQVELK